MFRLLVNQEEKEMLRMMEQRILHDIERATKMVNCLVKRDLLNQILGFLSCYLWANGDQEFYCTNMERVVHCLVYCFDGDQEDE